MSNKKIIYEGTFTLPSNSEQKEDTYRVLLEKADPLGSHVCEREAWKRAIEEQYEGMVEVTSLCIPSQEDVSVEKEDGFRCFSFVLYLKKGKTETETIFHISPRILHAGNYVNY